MYKADLVLGEVRDVPRTVRLKALTPPRPGGQWLLGEWTSEMSNCHMSS